MDEQKTKKYRAVCRIIVAISVFLELGLFVALYHFGNSGVGYGDTGTLILQIVAYVIMPGIFVPPLFLAYLTLKGKYMISKS